MLIAISLSASLRRRSAGRAAGEGDGLAGGVEHGRLRDEAVRLVLLQDLAGEGGVRPVDAHDDRALDVDPPEGGDDAVGDLFAPGDATEDVDEDGPDLLVGVDDLER